MSRITSWLIALLAVACAGYLAWSSWTDGVPSSIAQKDEAIRELSKGIAEHAKRASDAEARAAAAERQRLEAVREADEIRRQRAALPPVRSLEDGAEALKRRGIF